MKINIKTTNIELTDPIRDYLNRKVPAVGKFISEREEEAIVDVEVGKTTQHHKQGDVFRAEINVSWKGQLYRSVAVKDDLYAAIDEAKDEVAREMKQKLKKRFFLIRRGARRLKDLFRRGQ